MSDVSRRKMLGWTALTPLAGATALVAARTANAAAPGAASGPAGAAPAATRSELARRRIQRLHLPNVPLLTHEGKPVRFYDDLVKNKIVTMNFFYTKCDEICPGVTANLAQVQKLLGPEVGTK